MISHIALFPSVKDPIFWIFPKSMYAESSTGYYNIYNIFLQIFFQTRMSIISETIKHPPSDHGTQNQTHMTLYDLIPTPDLTRRKQT